MRPLEKREWIAATVAVVTVAVLFYGGTIWDYVTGGAAQGAQEAQAVGNIASTTPDMKNISTINGLEVYDLQPGTGAEAVVGKTVTAHYVGVLADGTKFDSSLDRGQPFSFNLGAGSVIRGWDLGLQGMKVGGIRRLVISPEYGYGAQPIGSIPANSTLIFEVQLLDVK